MSDGGHDRGSSRRRPGRPWQRAIWRRSGNFVGSGSARASAGRNQAADRAPPPSRVSRAPAGPDREALAARLARPDGAAHTAVEARARTTESHRSDHRRALAGEAPAGGRRPTDGGLPAGFGLPHPGANTLAGEPYGLEAPAAVAVSLPGVNGSPLPRRSVRQAARNDVAAAARRGTDTGVLATRAPDDCRTASAPSIGRTRPPCGFVTDAAV